MADLDNAFTNIVGDTGDSDITLSKKQNPLIGTLTQPFDNIGSNVSRMYDNFSSGKILGGLADTYKLATDPTGGWGSNATTKANGGQSYKLSDPSDKSNSPVFLPEHLNAPDSNGISTFNKDGDDFITQHTQNFAPQSQAVGIPTIPGMAGESQGKPGVLGSAANSSASSGISSLIAAFI